MRAVQFLVVHSQLPPNTAATGLEENSRIQKTAEGRLHTVIRGNLYSQKKLFFKLATLFFNQQLDRKTFKGKVVMVLEWCSFCSAPSQRMSSGYLCLSMAYCTPHSSGLKPVKTFFSTRTTYYEPSVAPVLF